MGDERGFWLGNEAAQGGSQPGSLAAFVGHSQAAKLGGLEPRLERGRAKDLGCALAKL